MMATCATASVQKPPAPKNKGMPCNSQVASCTARTARRGVAPIREPACPALEDPSVLVNLLDPARIGVPLSEELQLHPEQSTDALVVHHPEAKYFNAT